MTNRTNSSDDIPQIMPPPPPKDAMKSVLINFNTTSLHRYLLAKVAYAMNLIGPYAGQLKSRGDLIRLALKLHMDRLRDEGKISVAWTHAAFTPGKKTSTEFIQGNERNDRASRFVAPKKSEENEIIDTNCNFLYQQRYELGIAAFQMQTTRSRIFCDALNEFMRANKVAEWKPLHLYRGKSTAQRAADAAADAAAEAAAKAEAAAAAKPKAAKPKPKAKAKAKKPK